MRTRYARMLAAVAILILLGAIAGYVAIRVGQRSEEDVVSAYVRDLNAGDARALASDILPSSKKAAESLIDEARRPWHLVRVEITHEFGPGYGVADVSGTAGGVPLHQALPLVLRSGDWYVAVTTGPSTAAPTASTSRP